MAHDCGLADAERLQELAAVQGHVVEVIRNDRLGRPPEPDLIRDDDAETFFSKRVDWTAPIEPGEVHAVEEHDGPAVWLALRRHIHVYVDRERAELDTALAERSRVDVITAISGG